MMEIENISSATKLHNGVKMPLLGLGVYKAENGTEVIKAIHHAFEAGYRHIDTASYYENEEGVGEAIRSSGINRSDVFLTTKVWNDDQGFDSTLKAFDKSQSKLRTHYVDLYLIHWPVPGKFYETWRALEHLYDEGRVKAIGVSNFLVHHLEEVVRNCRIKPMVLQNEFHPRLIQQPLLDYCKKNEIQYEAWSPLMRGRILQNRVLEKIGRKYGKTPAQVVLRWDLQKRVVTIPKSVHKKRIVENADIFDFTLSEQEVREIDSLETAERTGADPDNFMGHFSGE